MRALRKQDEPLVSRADGEGRRDADRLAQVERAVAPQARQEEDVARHLRIEWHAYTWGGAAAAQGRQLLDARARACSHSSAGV